MKKLMIGLPLAGVIGWIVFKVLIFASAINQALDSALAVAGGK